MNAITITPAARARHDARKLAIAILAGLTRPYGTGYYTASDWTKAAQYLIDTDDTDEIIYMMAMEDAVERGQEWTQADYDNDDTYRGECWA